MMDDNETTKTFTDYFAWVKFNFLAYNRRADLLGYPANSKKKCRYHDYFRGSSPWESSSS
ncbi:hypothetical protein BN1423_1290015 [Carnobacterium maltaromaticum]|nr:hypothetical protein CM318V1_460008 [Carnobacterium maltaromaticum]CRH21004.1 hypothetical protein BN1423_1290015 [Carnobacterium maltaromaticum]